VGGIIGATVGAQFVLSVSLFAQSPPASPQRDLALSELDLVGATTTYQKAKIELDRATGTTLEHNGILIQDAISGVVNHHTAAN